MIRSSTLLVRILYIYVTSMLRVSVRQSFMSSAWHCGHSSRTRLLKASSSLANDFHHELMDLSQDFEIGYKNKKQGEIYLESPYDDMTPLFQWSSRQSGCWRPTTSDVELISWGKPARKKGTGSRGVPHRLNTEERFMFDQARLKGYVEVMGSGYRSSRRDSPLINSWRSWCDARAHVCLILHKGNGSSMQGDDIVLDLSPLRLPETFHRIGNDVDKWMKQEFAKGSLLTDDATIVEEEPRLFMMMDDDDVEMNKNDGIMELNLPDDDVDDDDDDRQELSAWEKRPIYQLPTYIKRWTGLNRSEAKKILKLLASAFETRDESGRNRMSKKPDHVKPGKNRRSGGYGIGGVK